MADPRAFISFDFDNNQNEKLLFVGQAKLKKSPFSIQDWSSKEALPQSQWEKIIEQKIIVCNLMIVLVGSCMASARGVEKEILMAQRANLPFFGIYVDGANEISVLPNGLARNRTISWTWDGVGRAIRQMMTEGKNSSGL